MPSPIADTYNQQMPSPLSGSYMQVDMELRVQRPSFLDISPDLWTVQDVHSFIIWCCEEYGIQQVDLKKFQINGKGLCLLDKENFCERIPDVGDVVFNKLKSMKSPYEEAVFIHRSSPAPLNLSKNGDLSPRQRETGCYLPVQSPGVSPVITINPAMSPVSSASTTSYRASLAEDENELSPLNLSKSPDNYGNSPPLLTPSEDSPNFLSNPFVHHYRNGLLSPTAYNIPMPVCHVKLEPNNSFVDAYGYQLVMPPTLKYTPHSPHMLDTDEPLNLNTKIPSPAYHSTSPRLHSCSPNENPDHLMFVSRNGSRDDDFRSSMYVSNYNDPVSSDRGEESPTETSPPRPEKSSLNSSGSPTKNGKNGDTDSKLLWEFINKLLAEPEEFSHLVRWEDKERRVFRIVNTGSLATLWGQQKNRTTMTYEKLSRSLRYYYKMNIISKEPGRRLTYRFMKPPTDIPKGQRGAKPGVPHRPRGWRQKMKEEQRLRKVRREALAQLQKEGADQKTIAAFLAENPIDFPSPCLGHPIGSLPGSHLTNSPLIHTAGDPNRQPIFPGMPMMSSPVKLERVPTPSNVEAKDIKIEPVMQNGTSSEGGPHRTNGFHLPSPLEEKLSAPSANFASTRDADEEEVKMIRDQLLQKKLQEAQMLKRRMAAYYQSQRNHETKVFPKLEQLSEDSNLSSKSESETEPSPKIIEPTTKKRRLLGYVEKGTSTPPPSFGRSLSSCDILPMKRKRYSQDDSVVHYADSA